VKVGISGDRYFEVLEGLSEGDEVIVGPFASVRGLREGELVRVTEAAGPTDRVPAPGEPVTSGR
jgi:HlyD family secretion protein